MEENEGNIVMPYDPENQDSVSEIAVYMIWVARMQDMIFFLFQLNTSK